jgi:hypothetical protein
LRAFPLLLLAAACATPQSAFPPIANMHSPTLCYIDYAGNLDEKRVAQAELAKRGFTCNAGAIDEGRQQWNVMAGHDRDMQRQARAGGGIDPAGLGLFLLLRNPPPVNCVSQQAGGAVFTNCR